MKLQRLSTIAQSSECRGRPEDLNRFRRVEHTDPKARSGAAFASITMADRHFERLPLRHNFKSTARTRSLLCQIMTSLVGGIPRICERCMAINIALSRVLLKSDCFSFEDRCAHALLAVLDACQCVRRRDLSLENGYAISLLLNTFWPNSSAAGEIR